MIKAFEYFEKVSVNSGPPCIFAGWELMSIYIEGDDVVRFRKKIPNVDPDPFVKLLWQFCTTDDYESKATFDVRLADTRVRRSSCMQFTL